MSVHTVLPAGEPCQHNNSSPHCGFYGGSRVTELKIEIYLLRLGMR